jgi:catechol 2,3-dioxygenase-like lactoylglutathione lyase family enzyme
MNAPAYNTVAWFQVGTTDAEQAKRFYGDLFGWRYTLDPNSEGKYHLVSYPGAGTPSGGIFDTDGVIWQPTERQPRRRFSTALPPTPGFARQVMHCSAFRLDAGNFPLPLSPAARQ